MTPVAKLIITQHMIRGAQCPNGVKSPNEEKISNSVDFDLKDLSDPITRDKLFNDNLGTKRKGNKQIKFLGMLI